MNILLGLSAWPAVLAGNLFDPDSYMRLERILQGIHQGHLVNIVAGDDGGAGVLVEWSRLLDFLLWLLAAPLAAVIGWRQALFAAGVAIGPLGVGVLAVSLAFAARPFAEDRLLWTAAIAAALLPGFTTFAVPGVVHYHILLLALIALSAGCVLRAWRGGTGFAFAAGLAGGFAIWLTPETMPFILMGYAALLLAWLDRRIGVTLAACGAGFFDVLGFALAIDPPQGGYAVAEIDRMSVVYVVLGLLLLAATSWLARIDRDLAFPHRRLRGVAVLAGVMVLWVAMFPHVALGPYGIMDAADMRRFFGVMEELQPLRGNTDLAAFLLPGLLALAYVAGRAFAARGTAAAWRWLYLAVCSLIALVLAAKFKLFVGFPALAAGALLPVAVSTASQYFRPWPGRAAAARIGIIAIVILLPYLPAMAAHLAPAPAKTAAGPSCSLRHIGPMLAGMAGRIVLAPAEDTPELLYRSQVETVGSFYQHGVPAFLRLSDAWRSSPGATPPAAVLATGASGVLFCHQPQRYTLVFGLPATTLWDRLQAGQPPPWLVPVAADPASGWQLFRIRP